MFSYQSSSSSSSKMNSISWFSEILKSAQPELPELLSVKLTSNWISPKTLIKIFIISSVICEVSPLRVYCSLDDNRSSKNSCPFTSDVEKYTSFESIK